MAVAERRLDLPLQADRLGHADGTTTLKVSSHFVPAAEERTFGILDGQLTQKRVEVNPAAVVS